MKSKNKYEVNFTSLKDGTHHVDFDVADTFFTGLDYSIIDGGGLKVNITLEKSKTMITAEFNLIGELKVPCDKCGVDFYFPVKGSDSLIYRFSDDVIDDEKVRNISSSEYKIDFTLPIYEFAVLLLPTRRIHPKGQCDPEVLKAFDNYLMVPKSKKKTEPEKEDDNIDPRWDKLKGLS